jgi:hypothetical protein
LPYVGFKKGNRHTLYSAASGGGSLPALAEADDDFKYVLKFRGAGHGVKMLISELIGGKITEILGLKIPELVL